MVKPSVEATVKQGRILRVDAPFDEALVALREAGCRYPISVKDLAYARMQKPVTHALNQNGSYTREGVLYFQDSNPILALNSPLLNTRLAQRATQANREGRYFATQDGAMYEKFARLAEEAKNQDPKDRKAVFLPKANCTLTTDNADFNGILGMVLKGAKDDYLKFNRQGIPLYLVDQGAVKSANGTLLTQLWFWGLDDRSELDGNDGDLGYDDRVRGVSHSERAVASETKTPTQAVLPYTPKDVKEAERELARLSKVLQPEQLTKLKGLIGRLR